MPSDRTSIGEQSSDPKYMLVRRVVIIIVGVILLIVAFTKDNISKTGKEVMKWIGLVLVILNSIGVLISLRDIYLHKRQKNTIVQSIGNLLNDIQVAPQAESIEDTLDYGSIYNKMRVVSELTDKLPPFREQVHYINLRFSREEGYLTNLAEDTRKEQIMKDLFKLDNYASDDFDSLARELENKVSEVESLSQSIVNKEDAIEFAYRVAVCKYYLMRLLMFAGSLPDISRTFTEDLARQVDYTIQSHANDIARVKEDYTRLIYEHGQMGYGLKDVHDMQYHANIDKEQKNIVNKLMKMSFSDEELVQMKFDVSRMLRVIEYIEKTFKPQL